MKRLIFFAVSLSVLLGLWLTTLGSAHAQRNALATVADITGSGAAVQVASGGAARWIQITAATGNAAVVRFGDSNVSATRGATIAPGGGQFLPPISAINTQSAYYTISTIYCYIANGDKVSITWAN